MQVQVINAQHPLLGRYIQSFLFFSLSSEESYSYTTFPNTNVCLAIYRNNSITYIKNAGQNLCQITSGQASYQSRLYGFHERPFSAKIESSLDQVCILFHPAALRAFTNAPYQELLASDHAFDIIFPNGNRTFLDRIFNEPCNIVRAKLLESFLLSQLRPMSLNSTVLTAVAAMMVPAADPLKIDDIARTCNINPSTLYRLFLSDIGQSPKSFFQTIRFRKALRHVLLQQKDTLTDVAYSNSFYDQPHFNKEMKKLSGYKPAQLREVASLEQGELAWIRQ